ncbi:MAG TPA: primosomal protein N', partial [Thermodesulfobacteriota bacterium]|nr:primosomal protein N' [Thermodesulfobacteriota bacterium]
HVLIQGNPEIGVRDMAQEIGNLLSLESEKRSLTSSLALLGPVPAPISKIKGRHRWQILLKGKDPRMLHQICVWVQETGKRILKGSGVQLILDVDPVDML